MRDVGSWKADAKTKPISKRFLARSAAKSSESRLPGHDPEQAIMLNLAGAARNDPDGTVSLSLQGDKHRSDKVLYAIRAGNKKSSTANTVKSTDAPDANEHVYGLRDYE